MNEYFSLVFSLHSNIEPDDEYALSCVSGNAGQQKADSRAECSAGY